LFIVSVIHWIIGSVNNSALSGKWLLKLYLLFLMPSQ